MVHIGCVNMSLDRPFEVEGEGKPNLVCSSNVESLITIDGTRNGVAGSGFDIMALPMSLVTHRPKVKGMVLRNLQEWVI